MAIKRRRQNPESAMLQSEADDAIITSGAVMDEVYTEYGELDNDLSVLAKIEAKILAKGDGKVLSKEARARRRAIKERLRKLDRLIAAYTNRVIKQAKSRLKDIKASPLAKLHKRNIATVERDIFKLENMVKRKGSDVRLMANSLIGGLVTLEDSMGIKASMGSRALSKKDRERENIRKLMLASHDRWGQVKKHARNHDKFFLRGSEVFHKDYGSGLIIDNDGRKITVKFEGVPYKEMTKAKLTPGPVMWVDAQFHALNNKFEKGRAIEKSDIHRVVAKIVKIHNHTKPRGKLKTYRESKRALEALIGKIETRLSGDKMDKATVESFLLELEDFHNRVPARMKSEWAKVDQRQWATDVSKVRKALVKLKRKANPCIGFHFHGKDAGELLKAVEESNARQRKGVKDNPGLFRFDAAEYKKKVRGLSDRQLQNLFEDLAKANWATRKTKKHKEKTIIAYKDAMRRFPESEYGTAFTARGLAQLKENPTPKRARKYGDVAEAKKSKRDKERGYRFKREQRTAAKGRRKMNPRKGMTIAKFAHWLGKPEAEVDTQKQKLEYLNAAAEWEDYGVVTPTELRDAQAIVRAQNPGKRKSTKNAARPKLGKFNLKRNDLVEIEASPGAGGMKRRFVGRVTDVARIGYGIREGDFFKGELGESRRALSLVWEDKAKSKWRLEVGTMGQMWDVSKVKVVGRAGTGPKGESLPKATVVDPRYKNLIVYASTKSNPKKKAAKGNPDDIWSDEITRAQATALKAWKKQHPEADDEYLRALLKWHDQHYDSTPKHATMAASRIGYTLGRSGSGIPNWFPRLGATLHDHAKEERKSGLRDSGRSPNPKGRTKKKATKKNVGIPGIMQGPFYMTKSQARSEWNESKEGWYFTTSTYGDLYGPYDSNVVAKEWARSVGSGGPSGPERIGNPSKKKVAKSNPNGNTVTAIVFKVGKKPKKVKSVWSAIEIAATVGGSKREFVPLGGDSGYMVFAKKPLGHENKRNDEATTTAGKKGHRPEIFGTAVLVPPSHRDEAFNASIGRQSRYGESPTERNPSKKKATKKKVAKKKVAKKKVTRKTKPEWQKLIDKCRKLWDDYCERPSKKRLKPVIEHLEKMKASTSKKVADERKSCLRIANKEARRLKLK